MANRTIWKKFMKSDGSQSNSWYILVSTNMEWEW